MGNFFYNGYNNFPTTIMSVQAPSSSVLELFTPEERRQIAINEINAVVQQNVGQSVRAVRSKVAAELQDLDPVTTKNYTSALSAASSGHDSVKVENLQPGIMGINYEVGSHNTAVDASMLSAETVLSGNSQLKEVLEHEDSEKYGHAGQVVVDSLVDNDGKTVDAITVLEGNVEDHMTKRHGQRSNQPKAVYGEGEEFVQVDTSGIDSYARGKTDRAKTQAEIFKKGNLTSEKQVEAMQEAGFTTPEMREVYLATRDKFENGPEVANAELAVAA